MRLLIRRELAVDHVDAGRVLGRVSLAGIKAAPIVARLVPRAALQIVNVLAPKPGVGRIVADPEAEFAVGDKGSPLVNLLAVGIDKTSDRISVASRAVRVELATGITRGDIDLGKVSGAGDLGVMRRNEVVSRVYSAFRHHPCAVTRCRAPRHFDLLRIADRPARCRRCPQAKVRNAVDESSLAHCVRTIGCPAVIVSGLARLARMREVAEAVRGVAGVDERRERGEEREERHAWTRMV